VREAAAAAALGLLLAGAAHPKAHVVLGRGVAWQPKELEVQRGDTVEWRNADIVPHNVRADRRAFTSKDLPPGASFKWRARKRGTYPYRCTLHPEMIGTVRVR
jgi:plastocyanin